MKLLGRVPGVKDGTHRWGYSLMKKLDRKFAPSVLRTSRIVKSESRHRSLVSRMRLRVAADEGICL